jgi:hypothetical protein
MSQTQCPSCGYAFDNQRPQGAEKLRGRLLYGPERLIAKARVDGGAFDVCPNCSTRFVAEEVEVFSTLARAKLRSMSAIYGGVALAAAALVAVLWVSGK